MDLWLRDGEVIWGMELKVWCQGRPDPINAGLEQLDRYLAGSGLDRGWLVIMEEVVTEAGRAIAIIRG